VVKAERTISALYVKLAIRAREIGPMYNPSIQRTAVAAADLDVGTP
jgi:hypothetical protein